MLISHVFCRLTLQLCGFWTTGKNCLPRVHVLVKGSSIRTTLFALWAAALLCHELKKFETFHGRDGISDGGALPFSK